jgi:hypothetical protein
VWFFDKTNSWTAWFFERLPIVRDIRISVFLVYFEEITTWLDRRKRSPTHFTWYKLGYSMNVCWHRKILKCESSTSDWWKWMSEFCDHLWISSHPPQLWNKMFCFTHGSMVFFRSEMWRSSTFTTFWWVISEINEKNSVHSEILTTIEILTTFPADSMQKNIRFWLSTRFYQINTKMGPHNYEFGIHFAHLWNTKGKRPWPKRLNPTIHLVTKSRNITSKLLLQLYPSSPFQQHYWFHRSRNISLTKLIKIKN